MSGAAGLGVRDSRLTLKSNICYRRDFGRVALLPFACFPCDAGCDGLTTAEDRWKAPRWSWGAVSSTLPAATGEPHAHFVLLPPLSPQTPSLTHSSVLR